jgi:hypothetical protein
MAAPQLQTLLQELCTNLDASALAYRQYLAGGKTFRYAQELKKYNGKITAILVQSITILDIPLQQDAEALLHHYRVWNAKWEQLAAEMNPAPDDVFVFANKVTFPRQSAVNFEEALRVMVNSEL